MIFKGQVFISRNSIKSYGLVAPPGEKVSLENGVALLCRKSGTAIIDPVVLWESLNFLAQSMNLTPVDYFNKLQEALEEEKKEEANTQVPKEVKKEEKQENAAVG